MTNYTPTKPTQLPVAYWEVFLNPTAYRLHPRKLTYQKKSCTTWDVKKHVNNGIDYQPQLVSRISAINSISCTPGGFRPYLFRLSIELHRLENEKNISGAN